jgi:Cys-tRNA synthase (O-phospho-L-seryl-tRNA:Cys-tRNA synthase)
MALCRRHGDKSRQLPAQEGGINPQTMEALTQEFKAGISARDFCTHGEGDGFTEHEGLKTFRMRRVSFSERREAHSDCTLR